jgi:hypothetical protein
MSDAQAKTPGEAAYEVLRAAGYAPTDWEWEYLGTDEQAAWGRAAAAALGGKEHPFVGEHGPRKPCEECGYTVRAQYSPGYRYIHPEGRDAPVPTASSERVER